MDIDGNGLIDLEEFCLCMARYIARKQQQKAPPAPKQSLSTKQLRDAFNYFDKDMSGSISQGELRQVMQTLGIRCNDTEFKALLDSVDENGDGVVDFPEFCTLLNSIV